MGREVVYLVGSEAVQLAGHQMRSAAEEIRRSVGFFESALRQHQQFMDEWLERFKEAMKDESEAEDGGS